MRRYEQSKLARKNKGERESQPDLGFPDLAVTVHRRSTEAEVHRGRLAGAGGGGRSSGERPGRRREGRGRPEQRPAAAVVACAPARRCGRRPASGSPEMTRGGDGGSSRRSPKRRRRARRKEAAGRAWRSRVAGAGSGPPGPRRRRAASATWRNATGAGRRREVSDPGRTRPVRGGADFARVRVE